MGRGVYTNKKCINGEPNHKFKANPHQRYVVDYFLSSKYKGLLLYHKLGSGKTCTSIMVADKFLKDKIIDKVYILTPGSLRENWVFEYCKTCGFSSSFIKNNFVFITYNFDVASQVRKLDFNRSLVIIDEVHNLINGVKNVSKNAYSIYTKILDANCRVLALSGTPVFSNTCEWSLLGNMLKPGEYPTIFKGDKTDPKLWDSCVISDESLRGIVSYYPGDAGYYPDVINHSPVKCEMGAAQYSEFEGIVDWEIKTRMYGAPSENLKKTNPKEYWKKRAQFMIAIKWISSRKISNFYYPFDEMIPLNSESSPESLDNDMMSEGMVDFKPDLLAPTGWFEPGYLQNASLAKLYSPKFAALFINIMLRINTKHAVFTFFKTRAGITMIHTLLTNCGIKCAVYSGDMNDRERASVLKQYNDVKNRDGDIIKVLLVTDAGAEGITLLEVNNVHILESSTRENRIRQAIGRAVRYKSHYYMPKDRQYVNVWRYWSVAPGTSELDDYTILQSVDQYLYSKGMKVVENLDIFSKRLSDNSIENYR
jgi:hypothetical protein